MSVNSVLLSKISFCLSCGICARLRTHRLAIGISNVCFIIVQQLIAFVLISVDIEY